jgi:hypothetical protein
VDLPTTKIAQGFEASVPGHIRLAVFLRAANFGASSVAKRFSRKASLLPDLCEQTFYFIVTRIVSRTQFFEGFSVLSSSHRRQANDYETPEFID